MISHQKKILCIRAHHGIKHTYVHLCQPKIAFLWICHTKLNNNYLERVSMSCWLIIAMGISIPIEENGRGEQNNPPTLCKYSIPWMQRHFHSFGSFGVKGLLEACGRLNALWRKGFNLHGKRIPYLYGAGFLWLGPHFHICLDCNLRV
jgi:hypothetical protein